MEMKSNGSSLSPILERHTPQHPLPEEIQSMGNDETICQFCGVSYLIHHEIKKLEDQVQALEKELSVLRTSSENEKKLKGELKKSNESIQSLQHMLREKEATINKMTKNIEDQKLQLDILQKKNAKNGRRQSSLKTVFQNRKDKLLHQAQLMLNDLKATKANMQNLKCFVKQTHSEFIDHMTDGHVEVNKILSIFASENGRFREDNQRLYEELAFKTKNEDFLQTKIKVMQNSKNDGSKAIEQYTEENENLKNQVYALQSKNSDFLEDVATLQSQLGIAKSDSAQMKDRLRKKQVEVQSAFQNLRQTEKDAEMTIQRMKQEMELLKNELIASNKDKERWRATEEFLRKQDQDLRADISTNSSKTEQLCDSLQCLKEQLNSLKYERQQMAVSHQNQITQLRESFREKLNGVSNPTELEERLQKQRQAHENEILELETHLKENHSIEMALQKEKHEEEIRAYTLKYKDLIEQNQSDARLEVQRLQMESNILQKQVASFKFEQSQRLEEQEREKTSLKNLISKLEEKITDLTVEHESTVITSLVEIREMKKKLHEVDEEKTRTEQDNNCLKQEVYVLQETVRRECEERFELTEALSSISEQLNRTKPDSSIVRTPVSAINGVTGQDSSQSLKLSSKALRTLDAYIDEGSSRPTLPDVISRQSGRNSVDRHFGDKSAELSPHIKDIMFSNLANHPKANSDASVDSVRRRIAAAIKRK